MGNPVPTSRFPGILTCRITIYEKSKGALAKDVAGGL